MALHTRRVISSGLARTIEDLRAEVVACGWLTRDVDRLLDAYDLALTAHPHVVLSSGRHMVSHGVGTASLAIRLAQPVPVVLACLVHTVPRYGHTAAALSSRRRLLSRIGQRVGDDVRAICEAHQHLGTAQQIVAAVPADPDGRAATVVRVLSRLEHLADGGLLHSSDAVRCLSAAEAEHPALRALCRELDLEPAAAAFEAELKQYTSLPESPLLRFPSRYWVGRSIVPQSLRPRRTVTALNWVKSTTLGRFHAPRRRTTGSGTRRGTPTTSATVRPPAMGNDPGPTWLHGAQVLVVGMGTIGSAVAAAAAANGAEVHGIDRDRDRLAGGRGVWVQCDITDPAALGRAWGAVLDRAGFLDLVVVTVGEGGRRTRLSELSAERWASTLAINVIGPALVLGRFATLATQERRPSVAVLFGSVHGQRASSTPDYATAKAAVTKLVENAAAELAPDGLRVLGVAPGWVALDADGTTMADLTNPVAGRSIEPAHLADLVLSLAAPTSNVSGVMVRVDNARSVMHPDVAR